MARATLGGGCFWCLEAVFQRQPGVKRVRSGYAGGKIANPGYRQVCAGDSGHAEVVEIEFDSNETSYDKLLELFWACHDPTTLNRQGADVGTQYRSVIFYHDESQKRMAEASRAAAQSHFERPIVTEILAAPTFYPAEDYHQNYYQDNRAQPYCMYVIRPKMEKLGLE
ncbi:MAG: peptide-methionine (S)-S-oxide reductase MsrA [Leptospirales bacterium]|nr:peptide-methionine (S)-S-oxide reductase MsrA [Leptospirales bacterium]